MVKKRGAGLKIDNSNSSIEPPKNSSKEIFDQKATEAFKRIETYKSRFWELSGQFKNMILDKVLPENKTSISKDIENEVLNKLVQIASEMNADATQPEGFGSITLNMLLMKMMLIQRDSINTLLFKVSKLESEKIEKK